MKKINISQLSDSFDKQKFIAHTHLSKGVEFSYVSVFKSAKTLRDFIELVCEKLWFDKWLTSKFILIADEMNNNAIEYGSLAKEINYMRISTEEKSDHTNLVLEVEDTGHGNKHKKSLDMETLRAHQLRLWYGTHKSIRGRGLFMIIVKLVDRLYFKDSPTGGLIVGIKKRLKK